MKMSKDEAERNGGERVRVVEEERRERRAHLNPGDWTREKRRVAKEAIVQHYAREFYGEKTSLSSDLEVRIRLEAHYLAREHVEEALGPSDNDDDRELVARIAGEANEDARQDYLKRHAEGEFRIDESEGV